MWMKHEFIINEYNIKKNELQAVNNIFNNFNKYNITMTCTRVQSTLETVAQENWSKGVCNI